MVRTLSSKWSLNVKTTHRFSQYLKFSDIQGSTGCLMIYDETEPFRPRNSEARVEVTVRESPRNRWGD